MILVFSTTIATATQPTAGAPAPPELYHLMREAELKVQEADKKMLERMSECGDLLSRNYRQGNKLPQSQSELDSLLLRSKLKAAKNPYYESQMLARELPPSTSRLVQFELITDYALSRNSLESIAKRPPKSWTGSPGTITVTQNSESMFALRGCGMDGKPILDRTTNSATFIFKDCAESDH